MCGSMSTTRQWFGERCVKSLSVVSSVAWATFAVAAIQRSLSLIARALGRCLREASDSATYASRIEPLRISTVTTFASVAASALIFFTPQPLLSASR